MATVTKQRTLHANHGILKFDGVEIGRVSGLNITNDAGSDYVYEVGSFDPVEINHNRGSYRITVNTMILREGRKSELHQFPLNLGDVKDFEISFTDRENGAEWVAYGCEPVSSQLGLQTNQRSTHNVTVMALGIRAGDGNRGEGQPFEGAPSPYGSLSDNFGITGNLPRILGNQL